MSPVIGKLLGFCYRRAWLVWIIVILLAVLGARNARNLRLNVSAEGLVPENSPLRAAYEQAKHTFGSDYVVGVYVEDPRLFTQEKLERLETLAENLAKLPNVEPETAETAAPAPPPAKGPVRAPRFSIASLNENTAANPSAQENAQPEQASYVDRVESLFTVSNINGQDGGLNTGPLLDPLPTTPESLADAKAQATRNPLFAGSLISHDGNAMLLTLFLNPDEVDKPGFDENFTKSINTLLAPEKAHFAQIFAIGAPMMHVAITQYIFRDQLILLPIAVLVLLTLLGLLMRSVHGVIVLLINATLANCWTLGLMALMGIPLNMLNYVVPALAVMVGSGADVHLMIISAQQRARGLNGFQAISETGRLIGLSLLLNTGTTVLGFAATSLTEISVLQEFGISAAMAILLRFVTTMTVVPAYLRVTERWQRPEKLIQIAAAGHTTATAGAKEGWWDRFLLRPYVNLVIHKLVHHPIRVVVGCVVITLVSLLLATRIRLDNDFAAFLHSDSPVMQQIETVSQRLSGTDIINIVFRGDPGEYRRPEQLREVFDFEQYLRKTPEVDSVVGLPDIIALFNREFNEGDAEDYKIPDDPRLISQFLSLTHPSELRPYSTANQSQINILVRCNLHDTTRLNHLVAEIKQTLDSGKFGAHVFDVTGHAVLAAASVDSIASGQIESLSIMVLILGGIVGSVFLSWRAAFAAVVANLTPVAVIFAVMGLCDVPLNLGTCMIAAISIGLAVDNTINLMVRYHDDLRRTRDETVALADTMQAEFKPIVLAGLSMGGAFLALGGSSFVPMQQFGLLSALVMILACAGDLVVTASLLGTSRIITVWGVLDVQLRKAIVKQSAVFEGFTNWQARKLIAASNIEEHPAGHHLIADGDTGSTMYVVLEGELEVTKGVGARRININRLGPGEVIGEVALVARVQRTADVTALTPVRLLSLDWKSLTSLQRFSPYLSARLNLNLARILGLRLSDTLKKTQNPPPPVAPPTTSVPWPSDAKTTEPAK